MKIYSLLLILFFIFISHLNTSGQTCEDKNQWVDKIESDRENGVDYECNSKRKPLELILNNCLLTQDSFHVSLWKLYFHIGYDYYWCGPEEKAIEYLNNAIKSRLNSKNVDAEEVGRIYKLISETHNYLKNQSLALEAIKKSTFYYEKVNSNLLPKNYRLLGDIYTTLGDYYQAFEYLEKAEKTLPKEDLHNLFLVKTTKAFAYNETKQYKKALKELLVAKTVLEQEGIEKNIKAYPQVLSDLGEVYFLLENYQSSTQYLNKAFSLFSLNPNAEPENIITNYNYWIQLQTEIGKYQEVEKSVNNVVKLATTELTSLYHPRVGETYYLSGTAYLKQKKINDAINDFQKSIEILVPIFKSKNLSENPILSQQTTIDKIRLRSALNLKAKAYQQKYNKDNLQSDLETAFDTYLTLDTLITQTRQSFEAVDSKYFLQKTIIPIFEDAINVSLQLFQLTSNPIYKKAAYNFIARNKAIILIESLQDEEVKFSSIPKALLKKDTILKKTYYKLEGDISYAEQEGDSNAAEKLRNQLFETKREYEKLIQSFEENYPAYYQAKYAYYSDINISEIQSKLEKDRAVIEFFVGEKKLFISILTSQNLKIIPSELPTNFITLCKEFIEITRREKEEAFKNIESRFSKVSNDLYNILLKKALDTLDPSINRLTIIPDNIILHMPMDALLTNRFLIKKWYDEQIPYLLKKYSTSLVYASSLLFENKKQEQIEKAQKSFLGFGIKYFDFTKEKIGNELDSIVQKRMINGILEYADDEVQEIKEIMGGDIRLDKDATKVFFLENASNYKVIHFASHAFGDENNPLGSSLIFAKTQKEMDYQLRVADIYTMDLNNTDLIVLSACQTNYGAIQEGEGMRTLSRAFAYAGSPSLIASSGNIPDKSSKDIIVDFYKKSINEGHPKDVALQLAKLNYLANADGNSSLPHLWAHLNVIGDVDELTLGNNKNLPWWIYLVGSILIIFFIAKIKS